jgi:hypothetical protein
MRHRTQLYLDEDQYRWLKRRAGPRGSIAGVVRQLIDAARNENPGSDDPLISFLLEPPRGASRRKTTVTTLDEDLYGS